MISTTLLSLAALIFWTWQGRLGSCAIDRKAVVQRFNPTRYETNLTTPMQVGNGNFAFGADITGLQSIYPYNILSSWCWHNSSLPTAPGQTEPSDFTGLDWWTHGRLVNYDQPNPAEPLISQWMIGNPHRVNLGRIGLSLNGSDLVEAWLSNKKQTLDAYNGILTSTFTLANASVIVTTINDPDLDTVAVQVESSLLTHGELLVFLDFPYMTDINKFEAPFVGLWNATSNHSTYLTKFNDDDGAQIQHTLDATTYFATTLWESDAQIWGPLNGTHRYLIQPYGSSTFKFTTTYDPTPSVPNTDFDAVKDASTSWWNNFWETDAFVDVTASGNSSAIELQRRIILSEYLLAVNEAGFDPPQESGLCNNGWYGKFHAEQFFWHLCHWGRWGKWDMLGRAIPGVYERFLPTSYQRAEEQGYAGARWGKESDPSGRSAPGEINSLLIWQQPHPMYYAELEYRSFPTRATLDKWDELVVATADFMASFAFWNESTQCYDLGPPMYPVSEDTPPNSTMDPTFELAYWRFGLDVAAEWQRRQGKPVPSDWTDVAKNLSPLPVQNDSYVIYKGIVGMWTTPSYDEDHPALLGINGWLPPQEGYNDTIFRNTIKLVDETWNLTYSYGWDFPMLAMTSARIDDIEGAIGYLLNENFQFDDAGYPIGGVRVPTPYFPGSSSLLLAVAMLSGGWDGSPGSHWPEDWKVQTEGFVAGI